MNNSNIQKNNYIDTLLSDIKGIEFKKMELDDPVDLYFISYRPKKINESIGSVSVLFSYSYEQKTLMALCPNIYELKKGDSTLNVLYAVNQANRKLANGNVTLIEKNVVYKYIEKIGNVELLTKDKVINVLNDIVAAIIYTYENIKEMKIKNEK